MRSDTTGGRRPLPWGGRHRAREDPLKRAIARLAGCGVALLAGLLVAQPGRSLSLHGVDFSNFLLLDPQPGSDLSLSTSGDIYLDVPSGTLSATDVFLDATGMIFVNVGISVTGPTLSLCGGCAVRPPDVFQDVVIRVNGPLGELDLDSGGSIVLDSVPVPEPRALGLLLTGLGGVVPLVAARRPTRDPAAASAPPRRRPRASTRR